MCRWTLRIAVSEDQCRHVANVYRAVTWRHCMLARRTTLNLKNGGSAELPMLVPSFSSKGFGAVTQARGKSKEKTVFPELEIRLALAGQFLDTSFLVSAYDLHHGHLS